MTKKRAVVAGSILLLLLLAVTRWRGEPALLPAVVLEPEPAQLALCAEAPTGRAAPAPEASAEMDPAAFLDDTGGPQVLLDTRGTLRVVTLRDDGTPEPAAVIDRGHCGRSRLIDAGTPSHWRMQAGPCTLVAWRPDGRLETPRQIARVTIETGQETTVTFHFPVERTGGIGVVLETTDVGAEVTEVLAGSAAEAAGLAPGDWILEVDGEDVADLSAGELATRLAGPEETPITFTVAFEGDTGVGEQVIETFRSFLPREDTGAPAP